MDLVEFVRARLDEDAAAARRVDSSWRQIGNTGVIVASDGERAEECANGNWAGIADHIVRHDPARVLKDIEAKRQTLQELEQAEVTLSVARPGTPPHDLMTGAVNTLRRVVCRDAAVHDDHPDYDERWRL